MLQALQNDERDIQDKVKKANPIIKKKPISFKKENKDLTTKILAKITNIETIIYYYLVIIGFLFLFVIVLLIFNLIKAEKMSYQKKY